MAIREMRAAIVLATLATVALLALSLAGKSGGISAAGAQSSSSVTCVPISCYGEYSYANQCESAKKSWEENKRVCEGAFNYDGSQASRESCIHSLDASVNKPCTCAAEACRKVTCTSWRVGDNSCASAEWRN
jgi:hypothetical protein